MNQESGDESGIIVPDREENLSIVSMQEVKSNYENFNDIPRRKENRLIFMKKWEDKRVQMCSIFTRIVERLNATLLRKGNDSIASFRQVIGFLRSKVSADVRYAQTRLNLISGLYSEGKLLDYGSLQAALEQAELTEAAYQKQLLQSATNFDKEVIQELLIKLQTSFEQRLASYSNLTAQLKKKYSASYDISLAKYRLYTLLYNETVKVYAKSNYKESEIKDMKVAELEYLSQVDQHYNNLKNFGKESILFYKEMMQMEQDRISAIKVAFEKYLETLKERLVMTPIDNPGEMELWDMSDVDPVAETSESFQVTELLEYQETHYIKKIYSVEEVTFDVFAQFVEDFSFKSIQEKPLSVKEVKAEFWQVDKWVPCTIILTVDKSLLVVEGFDEQRLPLLCYRVYPGCVRINIESREMVLLEKSTSLLCIPKCVEHRVRAEYTHELEQLEKLIQ